MFTCCLNVCAGVRSRYLLAPRSLDLLFSGGEKMRLTQNMRSPLRKWGTGRMPKPLEAKGRYLNVTHLVFKGCRKISLPSIDSEHWAHSATLITRSFLHVGLSTVRVLYEQLLINLHIISSQIPWHDEFYCILYNMNKIEQENNITLFCI